MRNLPNEFPRLVLGDHGFLPQYGSRLAPSEITVRMRLALQHGIQALAAGERFVSEAAMEAFKSEGRSPMWVRHVDLPLQLNGQPIDLGRAFAYLRHVALGEIGAALSDDPVMGTFFNIHKTGLPYDPKECRRLVLDKAAVNTIISEICTLKPQLVTLGGDILDFVMACDRTDLARSFLAAIADAADRAGACLYLCTYLGFGWPTRLAPILTEPGVAGFMLTINNMAAGMVPSVAKLREAVIRNAKPVAAMHVLLFGKLDAPVAIADALSWPYVRTAIVGASKPENIVALGAAYKAFSGQQAEGEV